MTPAIVLSLCALWAIEIGLFVAGYMRERRSQSKSEVAAQPADGDPDQSQDEDIWHDEWESHEFGAK